MVSHNPALYTTNTENDSRMKTQAEKRNVHRMAKVHNCLEMWQCSQYLHATQKECRTQNNQMTAIGYISDNEEIVNASWSNFQQDGEASFKLSERSPFPPALTAKDLPGGWTQVLNVCHIETIDCHPPESDKESAPEIILDTETWIDRNGDLDNRNYCDDDWEADDESVIEVDKGIKDLETRKQQDVRATPNVSRLTRPPRRSKKLAEKVMNSINAMDTRRNNRIKKT